MSLLNSFLSMITPSGSGVRRVQPSEAAQLVRDNKAMLVDVREPAEWSDGVVKGAALLPLSDLAGPRTRWKPFLAAIAEREIILYCLSGSRSGRAARLLAGEGFKTANAGGIGSWQAAGLPMGKPRMSR
jgi:rhodanese-related sulfurtransferase